MIFHVVLNVTTNVCDRTFWPTTKCVSIVRDIIEDRSRAHVYFTFAARQIQWCTEAN